MGDTALGVAGSSVPVCGSSQVRCTPLGLWVQAGTLHCYCYGEHRSMTTVMAQGWICGCRTQPERQGWLLWENSLKQPLRGLFFKNKFFLFKPAAPKKCPAFHTAQLPNQTRDYPGQGPTLLPSPGVTQLPNFSGTVLASDHSPIYSPQRLEASRSLLVWGCFPCQGRGGSC